MGLDDLEALVHERRGVYRDFGAHLPLRVAQSLVHGDLRELFAGQVAEGAAAARDDQPPYGRPFARETLKDGRVFGVYRQNRRPPFGRQPHDPFAGHDERFLVGQRQFLARAERRDGGCEAGVAHQRVDHDFGVARGGDLRHGLLAGVDFRVGAGQRFAQLRIAALVGDDRRVGVELPGLCREPLPVAAGRQHPRLEAVGVFAYDVERLYADGAGRTQYGDSLFHVLSENDVLLGIDGFAVAPEFEFEKFAFALLPDGVVADELARADGLSRCDERLREVLV